MNELGQRAHFTDLYLYTVCLFRIIRYFLYLLFQIHFILIYLTTYDACMILV